MEDKFPQRQQLHLPMKQVSSPAVLLSAMI
jgi:hypothetical protein